MTTKEMQEVLVLFMKKKGEALKPWGGDLYFTKEDEKELREWPPSKVEVVFSRINSAIEEGDHGDVSLCPWCQAHGSVCSNCGYGERHGRCDPDEDNTYGYLLTKGDVEVLEDLIGDVVEDLWKSSLEEVKND